MTKTFRSLPIDEDSQQQTDPQQAYFDQVADYNIAAAANNLEVYDPPFGRPTIY